MSKKKSQIFLKVARSKKQNTQWEVGNCHSCQLQFTWGDTQTGEVGLTFWLRKIWLIIQNIQRRHPKKPTNYLRNLCSFFSESSQGFKTTQKRILSTWNFVCQAMIHLFLHKLLSSRSDREPIIQVGDDWGNASHSGHHLCSTWTMPL